MKVYTKLCMIYECCSDSTALYADFVVAETLFAVVETLFAVCPCRKYVYRLF